MRNALIIAGREVRSSFATPLAYVVIAGFLLLSGFFFFTLLQQFNGLLLQASMVPDLNPNLNEYVVVPLFNTLEIVLLFLVPILTMRAIAEERRNGTFELLATSPLSSGDIVLGKFFGTSAVLLAMLLLSFCFPAVLILFTDVEVPPVLVGFLGVVLYSLALVALGIAISSFTRSQTVAAVISLVAFLVLYVIDAPAEKVGGRISDILHYIAPSSHTETLLKGVLTGSDLVYFLSIMLVGLFIANRVLDAQSWR